MKPQLKMMRIAVGLLLFTMGCSTSKNWMGDAFKKQVLSVWEDRRTRFFYDKTELPPALIGAYSEFRGREFSIANPNEPFNRSDVLSDLPQARLVLLAQRDEECLFIYESGGRSYTVKIAYFLLRNQKLEAVQVVALDGVELLDMEAIKKKFREKEVRFIGDWRFTNAYQCRENNIHPATKEAIKKQIKTCLCSNCVRFFAG